MQDIQQTMIQIFQKNISFLKNNHKEVFFKIEELEKNLIEHYHIDFVDNHFELVYENNYIYNCDPFYDASYRAKNIFNNENIFELISTKEQINTYGGITEDISASKFLNEYINLLKDFEFSKDKTDKFIFIGTLLGVHINDIHKVINSKVYLIIEPNLEIFRLSLFLTDYSELAQNSKLIFCVGDDELENKVKEFLEFKTIYNNFIRFELASKNELPILEALSEQITLENKMRYPFSEYLYSLKRGFYHLFNTNNGILKLDDKKDLLNNYPILFLGAGPSLDKDISFLKQANERFVIVAAAAVLKYLEKNNITPDIIISIDAGKTTVNNQFDVNKDFYKDSLLITSIKTDPEILAKFDNKNVFFIQTSLELLSNHGLFTGVTVGDIGIKVLLSLGALKLYILGFDAAIDEKSGQTHFSSYRYNKELKSKNDYKNYQVEVKGNFQNSVKTTLLYKDMIDSINSIESRLLNKTQIYNLSNGAYFKNTSSLKLINLDIFEFKKLNKDELRKSIKNQAKTFATTSLPTKDLNEVKKEIKIIKKLKSSNNKILEFDKLKRNYPNSLILQILDEFFALTNPYNYFISDNTLQINQFEKVIKEFENIYLS